MLKNLSADYSLVNLLKQKVNLDENVQQRLQLLEYVQDTLSFALEQSPDKGWNIPELTKRRDEIERGLKSSLVAPFALRNFSRDTMLGKIHNNEAIVDFFRIYNYDLSNAKVMDTTYYAMIDRPGWSSPQCIELCKEEQLQEFLGLNEQGVPKLLYFPQLRYKLYNLLWKPLETYLSGTTSIHYAPDGLLHRLNFYTLVTNQAADSTLFQKYQLLRYTDFRNFQPKRAPSTIDTIHVFANPGSINPEFIPLDAVVHEIDTLTTVAKIAQLAVHPYLGPQATRMNLLNIEKDANPYSAHVACHGFSLGAISELSEEYIQSLSPPLRQLAAHPNPLYRSGLVLSLSIAANQDSTGIVLAHEMAGMDLTQCQLMTLSACDSGLGWIENLEGVIGFQYALKTAGVQSLLVSLWKVQDGPTSRFMGCFYRHFLNQKTAAQALHFTIKELAQEYGPDVWGAFVLVN